MALMRASIFLLSTAFVAVGWAGRSERSLVGGWKTQDPTDPRFVNLAHYAVSTQVEGRQYYDTVLQLLEAETQQIVAGVNYKLKFTTTQSTCKVGKVDYSQELCQPKSNEADAVCTTTIYTVPWQDIKRVLSYHCEAPGNLQSL
ncbi:unnamed protein product [Ixodes hexagonus]